MKAHEWYRSFLSASLCRLLVGVILAQSLGLAADTATPSQPPAEPLAPREAAARVSIVDGTWRIGGEVTHRGSRAEGLLMNVRMVNATFEDVNEATRPKQFDADTNTAAFIKRIPEYVANGVRALTLNLQGGMPVHFNGTAVEEIPARIAALKKFRKPIVCNEDDKVGATAARAAAVCVASGASWGLMLKKVNQFYPFTFGGTADDPLVYTALKDLTSSATPANTADGAYFPPPESMGGWRKLDDPEPIRRSTQMDPDKLAALRAWLLQSDNRDFAAVVIRRGHIVLEVERGNSAKSDARRVASVSKAVCATVLAVASELSQQGKTPQKMTFGDRAFPFIPWAQPLSDPRKASITVKQLLNHTSGISPEATGSRNEGRWEYFLGHTGDDRTARLAFNPGTSCGYSTIAFHHAALVCETVTGKPYDEFAIEAVFKPLGIEHWSFETYDGDASHGRHVSHALGMPARDLARIGYCMLRGGFWGERQVVPKWFVDETAAPTHTVTGPEMRFKINAQTFSHGWELPARLDGERGQGLPADARFKPGSGGQLLAFVPSLDLVIARQTGSSGDWAYHEFFRLACAAVSQSQRD